jgi:hypothetical protein
MNLTPHIRQQLEQHLAGHGGTGPTMLTNKLPCLVSDRLGEIELEEFPATKAHYDFIKNFLDKKYPTWTALIIWEGVNEYTFQGYTDELPPR